MAASTYTAKTGAVIAPTDLAKVYFATRGTVGINNDWTEEVWTLKNSLSFDQVQGTKTEINVDQTTTAIAVKYAAGTTTFTFRVPDMANAVATTFLTGVNRTGTGEIGSAVPGETLNDTFVGYGYSLALRTVADKMVMLIYTNGWGIIFPHCEMVASLKKSGEDVWTLDITGTVLAGGGAGVEAPDVIFLEPGTPTPAP
jgi:hypothetical protein